MKQLLVISTLILFGISNSFGQSFCDSIYFHSDTVYINQANDNSVKIKFDFDWSLNPGVAYPKYIITLDDTNNIVFRDFFLGTFLGQQDSLDFDITYKNPSIPNGTAVIGTFDIDDPNASPVFECQIPIVFIFNSPLSVENNSIDKIISVYPNPFNSALTIDARDQQLSTLYITDLYGKVVKVLDPINKQQINLDELASGTYILIAKNQKGQILNKKLIKQL